MNAFDASRPTIGDDELQELYDVPIIAAVALAWIDVFHMFMHARRGPSKARTDAAQPASHSASFESFSSPSMALGRHDS